MHLRCLELMPVIERGLAAEARVDALRRDPGPRGHPGDRRRPEAVALEQLAGRDDDGETARPGALLPPGCVVRALDLRHPSTNTFDGV